MLTGQELICGFRQTTFGFFDVVRLGRHGFSTQNECFDDANTSKTNHTPATIYKPLATIYNPLHAHHDRRSSTVTQRPPRLETPVY